MEKSLFALQTAKPLLLASAIALVLTACGGSDNGHNAPIAEKPAPAPMPDNRVVPQEKAPSGEKQPQGNSQSDSKQPESKQPESKQPESKQPESKQPESKQSESKQSESKQPESKQQQKPDNSGNNADGGNPGNPPPPPQVPSMPKLELKENKIVSDTPTARGPAFLARSVTAGGATGEKKKLLHNVFQTNALITKVTGNSITFAAAAADDYSPGTSFEAPLELKSDATVDKEIPLKKAGQTVLTVRLISQAKRFGYADAQALHYYGGIGNQPFSLAYTIGAIADAKAVNDLIPNSEDKVIYRGSASYRPHKVSIDKFAKLEELYAGFATITLHKTKKTLDAEIDMQQSIGKSFAFSGIDYSGGENSPYNTSFLQEGNAQGIRGYFYGDKAQHIGGVYYVPEGSGAFITEVTGQP